MKGTRFTKFTNIPPLHNCAIRYRVIVNPLMNGIDMLLHHMLKLLKMEL